MTTRAAGDGPAVALVTGAGSGVGREVARALLGAGYRVGLLGRRAQTLAAAVAQLDGAAERSLALEADVREESAVRAAFAALVARFGRLDLLFNNAGVFGPAEPVDEYPLNAWRTVVDTNLTGAFLCAREAFRVMAGQTPPGGRIINNGSLSAHVPRPHAVGYTATKHAMSGLTKALWLEGRSRGIACGQIDIGNAATELTDAMAAGALQPDGTVAEEPRFDVAHVARAVLYVAELPLTVNVPSLTVMASAMPYVGRG